MTSELETIYSQLSAILQPLTEEETRATPTRRPGKWSIQQIVEHLLLSYESTAKVFEVRIAKGSPTLAKATIRQHLGQFILIKLGHFPSGREAPPNVQPVNSSKAQSGTELCVSLRHHLERMDALLEQAEHLFGPHTQAVSHQVLGPLSMPQWRAFHRVHAMHHLKQIPAILEGRALQAA